MADTFIRGAGGGSKGAGAQRVPVEAPDSLHSTAYAHVLDLVSEGEIEGFSDPVHPLSCVFLDETAIGNVDGTLNFKNLQVDWRYGTQFQDYIRSFGGVENEIAVGVEFTVAVPSWTHSIVNTELSAIRLLLAVGSLSQADTSNGDIKPYTIAYKIELATDGGSYAVVLNTSFKGKTSSKYERSHRIDLPPATDGWTIRVTRLTAKQTSVAIQDEMFIESYTEIVDGKMRMPMSAVVGTSIDAKQFNHIPSRAFRLKGRIIRVPSNYNPVTRVYTGVWDGTFQSLYSNNPAWVFYDMVTHPRYGLGHLINDTQVDKWALYGIAKYCDELVSDGKGGTEPRFTANLYLQSQNDALRVLQDMGSMFRGIMYVSGGALTAVADMPSDPIYTYAPANVIDGKFVYQGSSRKVRHTVALISWNDMGDFGRAKIEYVEDQAGIARYGIQQTEAIAVGCTSQSQARRLGKYILTTERYETNVVAFSVGLDGVFPVPGKIILIADPLRTNQRIGGRIVSSDASSVTLDRAPFVSVAVGHKLTCILPDGTLQQRTVSAVVGTRINVLPHFSTPPLPQSMWLVESDALVAQSFRVLSVTEKTDGIGFDITAIEHVAGKFDFIENDVAIDEPPTTAAGRLQAPAILTMSNRLRNADGGAVNIITADWTQVRTATHYGIKWRKDDGAWSDEIITQVSMDEWEGALAGSYVAKVWAIDARGFPGPSIVSDPIVVDEATLPVADVTPDSTGKLTLDCYYSHFRVNLTRNVTSVVFINVAPQDTIILHINQTGSYTIAFPVNVQSITGKPYQVTPGAGATDVVGLDTNNSGILWYLTYQAPSASSTGGAMAFTLPATRSASVDTDGITASAPSVLCSGSLVGGDAPITYVWTRTDTAGGTNFLMSSTTSPVTTFSISAGLTAFNAAQTWRCVATDANGFTATKSCIVTLTRVNTGTFSITVSGVPFNMCNSSGGPCIAHTGLSATPHNTGGSAVSYLWTRVDTAGGANFSTTGATTSALGLSLPAGTAVTDITQTWRCTATCGGVSWHVDTNVTLGRFDGS